MKACTSQVQKYINSWTKILQVSEMLLFTYIQVPNYEVYSSKENKFTGSIVQKWFC